MVLCAQSLRTIGWGAESFSRVALLPDARARPLARVFPNVLDMWSSPGAAITVLVVCAALSLLLAVGWWDRTAAVGLSYLGACFFVRSPLVASAWQDVTHHMEAQEARKLARLLGLSEEPRPK